MRASVEPARLLSLSTLLLTLWLPTLAGREDENGDAPAWARILGYTENVVIDPARDEPLNIRWKVYKAGVILELRLAGGRHDTEILDELCERPDAPRIHSVHPADPIPNLIFPVLHVPEAAGVGLVVNGELEGELAPLRGWSDIGEIEGELAPLQGWSEAGDSVSGYAPVQSNT